MAKRSYTKYKQGYYNPINKHKYKGKGIPRYLSSWEKHFFQWCDSNPNVIEWTSESIVVPYFNPVTQKQSRYMVDNKVVIYEGNKVVKYLVEIKPFKETQPPTPSNRKKRSTILYEQTMYARNIAKWEAAKKWADKRGYKFIIITERELFPNKN